MSKTSRFFLGALVGAAAALLLTPVTGKRLRSKAKKMAKDAGLPVDEMEEMAEDSLDRIKKTVRSKKNNNQK